MSNGQMPEGGQGGRADPAKILSDVSTGLEIVAQGMAESQQVPDQLKQRMAEVLQEYNAIIGELGSGAAEGAPKSGPIPMEGPQGGIPASPAI